MERRQSRMELNLESVPSQKQKTEKEMYVGFSYLRIMHLKFSPSYVIGARSCNAFLAW